MADLLTCGPMRFFMILAGMFSLLRVHAAERIFNFSDSALDNSPTNFTSLVAGRGKPGEWRVLLDEVSPALAPLTSKAPATASRAVLAQKAREPISPHFPMLIFDGDSFHDFKFTTRFKLMGGALDQSAGMVFRFQNESNFYVVQASAISGSFRCSKVVNGQMKPPIGPEVSLSKGEWHDLSVQCEGPRITCAIDGNESIKLVDNAAGNAGGKIGFCTQADAVSYFVDAKVVFTPDEIFAEKILKDTLKEYSRLVALKIFAVREPGQEPTIIASGNPKERGLVGDRTERDVIQTGHSYIGKNRDTVTVVLPLRDHNGDVMAAVSIEMKKFLGQTEDNALTRAQPIVRRLQDQVQTLSELLQ